MKRALKVRIGYDKLGELLLLPEGVSVSHVHQTAEESFFRSFTVVLSGECELLPEIERGLTIREGTLLYTKEIGRDAEPVTKFAGISPDLTRPAFIDDLREEEE